MDNLKPIVPHLDKKAKEDAAFCDECISCMVLAERVQKLENVIDKLQQQLISQSNEFAMKGLQQSVWLLHQYMLLHKSSSVASYPAQHEIRSNLPIDGSQLPGLEALVQGLNLNLTGGGQ